MAPGLLYLSADTRRGAEEAPSPPRWLATRYNRPTLTETKQIEIRQEKRARP
jgi:hypothetical protein